MEKLSKAEQILYNICLKQTQELFMKEIENVHKELKYFQPEISDIRVGYECEIHTMTTGGLMIMDMSDGGKSETICEPHMKCWGSVKCGTDIWNERNPKDIIELLKNGQIRTPYLTKEQIEAEGWVEMSPPIISISREFRNIPFIKDGYRLDYNINSNQLAITISREFLFYGECKSINELRIICKLLNIK
jgi:hypothetical protein